MNHARFVFVLARNPQQCGAGARTDRLVERSTRRAVVDGVDVARSTHDSDVAAIVVGDGTIVVVVVVENDEVCVRLT
jgi:hypothetical protein